MAKSFRSQRLLAQEKSVLIVVDVQASLTPMVLQHRRLVWNVGRLIRAAKEMDIDVHATEQYPKGLKSTVDELVPLLPTRHEKLDFSIAGSQLLMDQIAASGTTQIVLAGIETHICILQSAMDLLASGYDVFVVTDGVSARGEEDHNVALARLRDEGAQLVTTEGVVFEWCQTAAHPAFKKVSAIIREPAPSASPIA